MRGHTHTHIFANAKIRMQTVGKRSHRTTRVPTKTVAFNCKSAVSTSRSTIQPGNNHQHPRSSSLNTRKPKQKLMPIRKEKNTTKLWTKLNEIKSKLRKKNRNNNKIKKSCRNRRFKVFRRMLERLVCHFNVKIATRVLGTQYSSTWCLVLVCRFLHTFAPCTYTARSYTARERVSIRTLGIHATKLLKTKDPLIFAFCFIWFSSRINAHRKTRK